MDKEKEVDFDILLVEVEDSTPKVSICGCVDYYTFAVRGDPPG